MAEAAELLDILTRSPDNAPGRDPDCAHFYLLTLMRLGRVDDAARHADALIAGAGGGPTGDALAATGHLFAGLIGLGRCQRTGCYDFHRDFAAADALFARAGRSPGKLYIEESGVYFCRINGIEPERLGAFLHAVEETEKTDSGRFFAGLSRAARCEVAYIRRDYQTARAEGMLAARQARAGGGYILEAHVDVYRLLTELHIGDSARLIKLLTELDEQPDYPGRAYYNDIVRGVMYVGLKQLGHVAPWLRDGYDAHIYAPIVHGADHLPRCWILQAEKQYAALLSMLEARESVLGPSDFLFSRVFTGALRAICHYKLKNYDGAADTLRETYQLAGPGVCDTIFIDFENDMRSLTTFCIREGGCGMPMEWLKTINRSSAAFAQRLAVLSAEYEKYAGIENRVSLTPGERAVLLSLQKGLSRAEIATERGLSINTVKSVVRILLTKLNAKTQTEAVLTAIKLKLIE
jgi:DNA-binding CsgD family transcriptional regulator